MSPTKKTSQNSVFEHLDYRSFLQSVLNGFKERNTSFSLRALAKKFEMQPSNLSEIIAGKKKLTLEKSLQIGQILKMTVKEITFLCYLVALESCSDPQQKLNLETELSTFLLNKNRAPLALETFQVVAQWECIAILEILAVYTDQTVLSLAQLLGLAQSTTEKAISYLISAKLIEKTETGYTRSSRSLLVSAANHNLALKMYHSSMLEKARHAIYEQSPTRRYTGTETLMIDPVLLPDAHQIMNECLDRLLGLFDKSEKKTSLVHIHFNLFEMLKEKNKAVS